ncbi:MAG: metallophosphoesterase [Dehalococcoidia bacterium]|nr:metallophosphoesterase [Dehalococcoidia bacterium]
MTVSTGPTADATLRCMRIGILSDTHLIGRATLDDLSPEAAVLLSTVDLILHAGDVVLPSHLAWCEQFAPLLCARGNNDHFDDPRMAPVLSIEREGWRIGVVHDIGPIPPSAEPVSELKRRVFGDVALDILVAGDSHFERLEHVEGTLFVDSASPTLPHHKSTRLGSMALLDVTRDHVRAEIIPLGETPGLPNPVTAARIEFDRGGVLSASIGGAPAALLDGHFRWRGSRAGRRAG